MIKNLVIAVLVGALVLTMAVAALAQGANTANVEIRVWERTDDPARNYISARPEGGSWQTLGTIALPLDGETSNGRFRYGDITLAVPFLEVPDTPPPATTLGAWEFFEGENIQGPFGGYYVWETESVEGDRTALVVRCTNSDHLDAFVATSDHVPGEEPDSDVSVRYRFAESEVDVTSEDWRSGLGDGAVQTALFPQNTAFIMALRTASGRLFFNVTDSLNITRYYKFDVTGAQRVFAELDCE
ncbi:MAG: hypothetical protein OXE43_07975 [Chloroflexi bacterium]|nr:hypothetical protein [Chloroflexota bacterium]